MTQTLQFAAPEEAARANFYGLIARLFYSAPDARLIAELRQARPIEGEGALAAAWREMVDACASAFPVVLEQEHTDLFVGTGKAEVTPYASYYLVETGREKILVRLRGELAGLGLARRGASHEPEDHIAALFDVMRHLISTGSGDAATQQKGFFERYIEGAYGAFCDATSISEKSNFYKHVARFAKTFLDVESEALKVF